MAPQQDFTSSQLVLPLLRTLFHLVGDQKEVLPFRELASLWVEGQDHGGPSHLSSSSRDGGISSELVIQCLRKEGVQREAHPSTSLQVPILIIDPPERPAVQALPCLKSKK